MPLPFSLPSAQYQAHKVDIDNAIAQTLSAGIYILGPQVTAFEQEFAQFVGAEFGVGVNSGTDAITLALKALGIGSGDEVVTTSLTAVATVAAIELAGATPILVDVERSTRTMDPALFEAAITDRTKAVVVVHLYGQAADMDNILAIARRHDIKVVEDCAQCAGATFRGERLGSLGDAACFSFYPTKNLGAIGDGGMVVTNDSETARIVRELREYGWSPDRLSHRPGFNSRLDEIQAAILRVKLPHLDSDNARRQELAQMYDARLPELGIAAPAVRPGSDHVYHLYVVEVDDRPAALDALRRYDILGGIHYATAVHHHPAYAGRIATPGGMTQTDALTNRILTVPLFPEMEPAVIDRVSTALAEAMS